MFYEGVLGLVPILEDEFAIVLDANGVELRIQKVQTLTPQPQTQLGWSVISLEEVVRAVIRFHNRRNRFPPTNSIQCSIIRLFAIASAQ